MPNLRNNVTLASGGGGGDAPPPQQRQRAQNRARYATFGRSSTIGEPSGAAALFSPIGAHGRQAACEQLWTTPQQQQPVLLQRQLTLLAAADASQLHHGEQQQQHDALQIRVLPATPVQLTVPAANQAHQQQQQQQQHNFPTSKSPLQQQQQATSTASNSSGQQQTACAAKSGADSTSIALSMHRMNVDEQSTCTWKHESDHECAPAARARQRKGNSLQFNVAQIQLHSGQSCAFAALRIDSLARERQTDRAVEMEQQQKKTEKRRFLGRVNLPRAPLVTSNCHSL